MDGQMLSRSYFDDECHYERLQREVIPALTRQAAARKVRVDQAQCIPTGYPRTLAAGLGTWLVWVGERLGAREIPGTVPPPVGDAG